MKDDAVIKDNEAVYLLNEQTYLHLRENLAGVGYEVFDKNSPLPVEEGQIPREALGNTQRRIETARAYYLAEHQDEPVGRIQNVAVTTLEKFRSGVRKRRNLAPRSLPENDVRFIDPMYNELFRVPDGGVVQMTFPDGHQRSEVVEYLDDYHMKIGSTVQHICEFAERMARSHAIVEPEPLTQQEQRAWNLEYDYYLTVQAADDAWEYALYQGDCCLLERGKIDAPELMIEEVRDEILYSHNLRNKDCIPLCQEEFAQKLADRNEIQSYRMLEQVIVLSLLNSGVRRGELAGLTWKDVNFEECTIHISKSLLVFKDYGYQLTTTKESNIRDVDVAPEYMDFLKEYYKYWKSQKKLMGGSWQKSLDRKSSKYAPSLLALRGTDFVICNDHGFPINPDSYGALVRRIGQRAGIEGLHPHMFRHTFVSILLSNPEIGVATVAAEAGHAQPSTTLAIYTQVYDKRRKEIRNQMSKELYE